MFKMQDRLYFALFNTLCQKDKDRLYRKIWDEYSKRLAFYISNFIPENHPDFPDLFQEVMIKILGSLDKYNPLYSINTWVYKIASNHCLDFVKSRKNHLFCIDSDQFYIAGKNSVEDNLDRAEINEKIQGCIRKFDPVDQKIAYLKIYENLTHREIANVLKMNVNTVKYRYTGIKSLLKKILEDVV